MKIWIVIGVFVAALASTGSATAAPIVYTLSGTASGRLNDVAFSGATYTITATGDTANLNSSSFYYALDPLDSVTITIAGLGDLHVIVPLRFGEVPNLGFFFGAFSVDILDGFFLGGLNVDISMPFGPITSDTATTDDQFLALPVDAGLLWMTSTSTITYSAAGGAETSTLPALLPPGSPLPSGPGIPQWYCEAKQIACGTGSGPGGVPEPATWMMLLIGFAGIGITMRGRPNGSPSRLKSCKIGAHQSEQ